MAFPVYLALSYNLDIADAPWSHVVLVVVSTHDEILAWVEHMKGDLRYS